MLGHATEPTEPLENNPELEAHTVFQLDWPTVLTTVSSLS